MILVLVITFILAGQGVPEAEMLWTWFGDHLFWTVLLTVLFL